jgi:hypothetical protein
MFDESADGARAHRLIRRRLAAADRMMTGLFRPR